MAERRYSAGTIEALFMLSRGHCYNPSCRERVLKSVEGTWRIKVHVAHIFGLNTGSARYRSEMTDKERNHFRNLMLLCKPHHDEVDVIANEHLHDEDELRGWKNAAEGDFADELDEIDWLTQEKLERIMSSAVVETKQSILTAIASTRSVGDRILELIHELVDETLSLPYLDPEAIAALEHSAQLLEHLPDNAESLSISSRELRHLPDTSEALRYSAVNLQDLQHALDSFSRAVAQLHDLYGHPAISRFPDAVDKFDHLHVPDILYDLPQTVAELARSDYLLEQLRETAREINTSARNLTSAARDTEAATSAVEFTEPTRWSWNSFRWGMAVCLLAILAVLIAFSAGVGQQLLVR